MNDMQCPNCGSELKRNMKRCKECGLVVEEITTSKNNKSNFLIKLCLVFAFAIALAVASFAAYNLFNNKSNTYEDDYDIEENDTNTIAFYDYTLTIPDEFTYGNYEGKGYIQNGKFYAMFDEYPLSYQNVVDNKQVFIDELQNKGYSVESFSTKKVDGRSYILIKGLINDIPYGYLMGDIDVNKSFYMTITSIGMDKIEDGWYDTLISFIRTARK